MGKSIHFLAVFLTLILVGCSETSGKLPSARFLAPHESMLPGAFSDLIVEEKYVGVLRHRLLLPNSSDLIGDNLLIVTDRPARLRFALEDIDDTLGETVPPFPPLSDIGLRSRVDALGALIWAEWVDGAGQICVVALRRLPAPDRDGAPRVRDLHLRNCLPGDREAALAPLSPVQLKPAVAQW